MSIEKQEFRNMTDGTIGVTIVQPGGKVQGIPLVAGATVWLSEEDQIATANAPRRDEDNPFVNGNLAPVGMPKGVKNRRPIGVQQTESEEEVKMREQAEADATAKRAEQKKAADIAAKREADRQAEAVRQAQRGGAGPAPKRQSAEETGAPPQPQGKQAEGSRAAGEEVGTPEAAAKAS